MLYLLDLLVQASCVALCSVQRPGRVHQVHNYLCSVNLQHVPLYVGESSEKKDVRACCSSATHIHTQHTHIHTTYRTRVVTTLKRAAEPYAVGEDFEQERAVVEHTYICTYTHEYQSCDHTHTHNAPILTAPRYTTLLPVATRSFVSSSECPAETEQSFLNNSNVQSLAPTHHPHHTHTVSMCSGVALPPAAHRSCCSYLQTPCSHSALVLRRTWRTRTRLCGQS